MSELPKARNAGHALASVMVDELVRCGMTHACLGPGSRSTPVALALAARPEIDLHVNIDERSAAFFALGAAKASRRPVAVLTTSGTATANLFPAIVEAFHAQVPMIVLTADRPPELRDTGAGQTIDQVKLYGGMVRWFLEVGVAEARPDAVSYWRSVACRAFHTSQFPSPGPVHLNLAFRNPLVPVADEGGFPYPLDGRPGGAPWTRVSHPVLRVAQEDLDRLRQEVDRARKGIIVAGTGEFDGEAVLGFARSAGWPVLAEATSNLRQGLPAICTYDALLRDERFAAAHRPDLVLRIGNLGTSQSLAAVLDSSVRQISISPSDWLDPGRSISWLIRGSVEEVFRRLGSGSEAAGAGATAATGTRENPWLSSWLRADEAARRAIDSFLDFEDSLTEPRIARDVVQALPEGGTLFVASSMPIRDLDWFMRPRRVRILANRGANGIDGFVSCVLGAGTSGDGPTAALCGDLSFLHDQNGLLPASQRSFDVVFVVVNNDGGGIFSFLPQAAQPGFEQLFGTPHHHSFALLAGSYGCRYRLVQRAADVGPAVAGAVASGGTHIIEVHTDRPENVELHRRIWDRVRRELKTL